MLRLNRIFSVVACLAAFGLFAGADGCKEGSTVEITIFHTNDLHSHFKPEQPYSEKNPYNLGGLARLKTLVDKLRAQKQHNLLLDAGDYSEGTSYYAVDAGTNMLRILDAIGYDAVVVGNHDFLNGPTELANTIERANPRFPVLGANKNLDKVPNKERVASLVKDYTIIERGGVKIGIIGILCDDALYYPYFKPAIVTNAVDKASQIAKKLRDEKLADVIVLLSHNSLSKQIHWAKQVPWVNVVISGHSHEKTPQPLETTNAGQPAYVVETGQWGQFLGELTLTVDTKNRQTKLKSFKLHPVSADNAEDPTIAAMIEESDRALSAKFGADVHQVVAHNEVEMLHDTQKEGPIGNLVADAYRDATGSDVALETILLTSVPITPGPLTRFDLMNVVPHIYSPLADSTKPFPQYGSTWTLKKVHMRGVDLRGIMNVVFLTKTVGIPLGWIAGSGVHVTYGKAGGASPVHSLNVLNRATGQFEAVQDDRVYTVTMHDGLLLAFTEILSRLHLNIDLSQREETGIQTWDALINFASAKGTIRAEDFEAGTRFRNLEADLGIYAHTVKVAPKADGTGYVVNVAIQNEGLVATQAGMTLRVVRSAPDDAVNAETSAGERKPISAEVAVPPLDPGARAIVQVPWTDLPGPGIYELDARIYGTDASDLNNHVKFHARIQ